MTAKPMSFFKNKLQEVSKQLYLENGWQMPKGLVNKANRDPRNFSLAEWQQAKRIGHHAGELKGIIQEAWAISDSRATFSHALEERGLYLARGDRRGHVAVTFEGEVISIPRATGRKTKEIQARLGKPDEHRSIEETRKRIAEHIFPRMQGHLSEAHAHAKRETGELEARRQDMAKTHADERAKLDAGQKTRNAQEAQTRAERFRNGMKGLWDRLTGKRRQLEKQNELEAFWALQRDQEQRQALVHLQLQDRQQLQAEIKALRSQHAQVLQKLHSDAANYRLMQRGEAPMPKSAFERLEGLREQAPPKHPRQRLDQLIEKKSDISKKRMASDERLKKLRERERQNQPTGPQLEP